MVELVDTQDLKSCSRKRSAGSIPALSTLESLKKASEEAFFILEKKAVPKNVPKRFTYRKRFLKERTPYKLPKIVRANGDWHVKYFYEFPDQPGKFKEFRVRDGINYIHDLDERDIEIKELCKDIEYALKVEMFNPFLPKNKIRRHIKEKKAEIEKQSAVMTLDGALLWYVSKKRELGKSEKTLGDYQYDINPLITWCKKQSPAILKIDEITIDHVESYLADQAKAEKWKARTYNNKANSITTFFNYLQQKRKLKINPIQQGMLERRTNKAEKNKYYDQDTLNLLLPKLKKKPVLRRRILWGYYTCARGSELRMLKIKDIDFNIQKITISAEVGKTGATVGKRSIPICQELMDIINEENLRGLPGDYFIFGPKGLPGESHLGVTYFSDMYKMVKEDINIDPNFTIYSFKHTRVVDLLVAGFDPIKVMYITGHSDWSSFQKYIRELGAVMDKQMIGNTLKLGI
jgi:site-specific recombinase XerD